MDVDEQPRLGRQEGRAPGQHAVEERARRVDVGARAHGVSVELLGRGVARRPDEHAGGGQAPVGARVHQLRDAEVEQLDQLAAARDRHEEDVRWLEVAVHHAGLVRRLERGQRLQGDARGAPRLEPPAPQELRERLALEQLHHQEGRLAGRAAEVGHLHDVRVAEPADRARLALEALDVDGLGRELRHHHLEGDAPAEILLQRLVDAPHPPRPIARTTR
ncbi:MAG: hypothetical protein M5U28_06110 [Sandaracinaceae bacterium]|nr:hypothetical protein [Sandaracinaceae bacterium]